MQNVRADPDALERSERDHELRAALCGIEAAALALKEQRDRMSGADVDQLALAIASEARRLRAVLAPPPREDVIFNLVEAVRPAILLCRSMGVVVRFDEPGRVWVVGERDIVAQVVLALLDNARVHAAPSPVDVRIGVEAGVATLFVEDRGPGIDGQRMFTRGRRGPASPGSGLGLYIAQRLVAGHGGSLTAQERPGGGASFALALQSAPVLVG